MIQIQMYCMYGCCLCVGLLELAVQTLRFKIVPAEKTKR